MQVKLILKLPAVVNGTWYSIHPLTTIYYQSTVWKVELSTGSYQQCDILGTFGSFQSRSVSLSWETHVEMVKMHKDTGDTLCELYGKSFS